MEGILKKTLIVRLSSAGDIVLASLLIRTLHARFPSARIDFLVKHEYAPLVAHNPLLSQILTFPTGGSWRELRHLRRVIRSGEYDLIIDIHDSLRSRLLCAGQGKVVRVRKRKIARSMLVWFKRDWYDRWGGAPGVALRYLEPLRPYGVTDDQRGLELTIPADVRAAAAARLEAEGLSPDRRFIAVCPTARHFTKIWPADRFASAAAALAEETQLPVALFGAADEREQCTAVAAGIHAAAPTIHVANMAGTLTLLESAAALDASAVVLCNDSGLMHLAAARKRPVVAVFGSTVRQFGFFPFGTRSRVIEHAACPCRPCTHVGRPTCPQSHFRCMMELEPARVVEAARALLNG
jgi:heptosyltransferase-2